MSVQGYHRPHGDLWRRWRKDWDEEAQTGLYEVYAYLVPKTRQRMVPVVPAKIDADDLLQEGRVALLRAVEDFNPDRPVKFESYALSLVRGSMLEFLRTEDWVPRSVRTKGKQIAAAEAKHEWHTGQPHARPEDLAAVLGMDIDAFYRLYRDASVLGVVSLEDEHWWDNDAEDFFRFADHVVAPEDPAGDVNRIYADAALHQAVAWLPVLERLVIRGYYQDGLTLKQIAKDMGRSESRAHQLHTQATTRLAGFLRPVAGLWGAE